MKLRNPLAIQHRNYVQSVKDTPQYQRVPGLMAANSRMEVYKVLYHRHGGERFLRHMPRVKAILTCIEQETQIR